MAKIQVLESYWDKLFGQMFNMAIKLNDKEMKLLCSRIAKIPENI